MSREVLIPFRGARESLGVVRDVRSTLITTSQQAIRARGLFDRYLSLLSGADRQALMSNVAGQWIPVEYALAHYRACDALGFTASEQVAIGTDVGERVHGTFLGVMVRTAKTAGVTPWTALNYSQKLYDRLFQGGGGISVVKLGPKEARAEVIGVPLVRVPYFRNGFRGLYQAGVQLFCEKVYTYETANIGMSDHFAVRISWV